jgi:hypothetical protein
MKRIYAFPIVLVLLIPGLCLLKNHLTIVLKSLVNGSISAILQSLEPKWPCLL